MKSLLKKSLAQIMMISIVSTTFGVMPVSAVSDNVTINVIDGSGKINTISNASTNNTSTFQTNSPSTSTVEGLTRAVFQYKGDGPSNTSTKLKYQFVSAPVTSKAGLPADNWNSVPISANGAGTDLINTAGQLTRKSYDVTMLPTINDTATWNDLNKVYKYGFNETATLSVSNPTTGSYEYNGASQYGKYIDYVDYRGNAKRRFLSNSVFFFNKNGIDNARYKLPNGSIAQNSLHDLYPSSDTSQMPFDSIHSYYNINGTRYLINKSVTNGVATYSITYGSRVINVELAYYFNNDWYTETEANQYKYTFTTINGVKYAVNRYGQKYPVTNYGYSDVVIGWNAYSANTDESNPAQYQEASKFWGYLKPTEEGDYYFSLVSDDGSKGVITVGNTSVTFADGMSVHGSQVITTNKKVHLTANQYYPLYLQYFNWGGGARFMMYYTKSPMDSAAQSLTSDGSVSSALKAVPNNWFYPSSKSDPGETANTIFTGGSGVDFPTAPGTYYLLYKTERSDGTIINAGCYGPFEVKGITASQIFKNNLGSVISTAKRGDTINVVYTVTPVDIPKTSAFTGNTITAKNLVLSDSFKNGFTVVSSDSNINGKSDFSITLPDVTYTLNTNTNSYTAPSFEKVITVKCNSILEASTISQDFKTKLSYTDPSGAGILKYFSNANLTVTGGIPVKTLTIKLRNRTTDQSDIFLVPGGSGKLKLTFQMDDNFSGLVINMGTIGNIPADCFNIVDANPGSGYTIQNNKIIFSKTLNKDEVVNVSLWISLKKSVFSEKIYNNGIAVTGINGIDLDTNLLNDSGLNLHIIDPPKIQ